MKIQSVCFEFWAFSQSGRKQRATGKTFSRCCNCPGLAQVWPRSGPGLADWRRDYFPPILKRRQSRKQTINICRVCLEVKSENRSDTPGQTYILTNGLNYEVTVFATASNVLELH